MPRIAGVFGSEIRPTRLRIFLKSIKYSRRNLGDFIYDFSRYFRHSSTFLYGSRENLASRITAIYHNVEKGLSLPDPRPGFGGDNIGYLVKAIQEYVDRFGLDTSLRPSAGALAAYVKFNEAKGVLDYPNYNEIERVLKLLEPLSLEDAGGTISISGESIHDATQYITDDFFFKRHSIRQFSDEDVGAADINAAIAIAQRAPAVCNRQNCFVYVVHDKRLIAHMLMIQGGARGFADRVNKLLVVTNKLSSFWGSGERNQCWIDGGLFAMSLIFGLHAKGLGTCCLNWSKTAPQDKVMRSLLNMPPQEVIIMLVAVGHIPKELKVARSTRNPIDTASRHILDWTEIQ